MAVPGQLDILKQGVGIWNVWRKQNPGHLIDLSHADLRDMQLQGVDLSHANLKGTVFDGSHHETANMEYADFSEGSLRHCHLEWAKLGRSLFYQTYMCDVHMGHADLQFAKIRDTNFDDVDFSEANMQGIDAVGFSDIGVDFTAARIGYAKLSGAILIKCNLSRAFLEYTDLSNASLGESIFVDADISNVNLSEAILSKANFTGADLTGANLAGANLTDANLIGANLTGANFSKACVSGVRYKPRAMARKCQGVRVDDCHGNALFKRDAQDQDYIDTLWDHAKYESRLFTNRVKAVKAWFDSIRQELRLCRRRSVASQGDIVKNSGNAEWQRTCRRNRSSIANTAAGIRNGFVAEWLTFLGVWQIIGLYLWWISTNYGRCIPRVITMALAIIYGFGIYYQRHPELLSYSSHKVTGFSPFYYSIVIFATLGFGDVSANGLLGEVLVACEVLLGYISLGLLLSILGNKVARRS